MGPVEIRGAKKNFLSSSPFLLTFAILLPNLRLEATAVHRTRVGDDHIWYTLHNRSFQCSAPLFAFESVAILNDDDADGWTKNITSHSDHKRNSEKTTVGVAGVQ